MEYDYLVFIYWHITLYPVRKDLTFTYKLCFRTEQDNGKYTGIITWKTYCSQTNMYDQMNMRFLYFTVAMVLFVKSKSDIILSKFQGINIYKDIPKVWHAYIRIFIFKYLKRNISHNLHGMNLLSDMFQHSRSFQSVKNKSIKTKCTEDGLAIFWWSVQHVTFASRQIYFDSQLCKLVDKRCYHFNLHP